MHPLSNSAIRRDRNIIPLSTPMFSGSNVSMLLSETLPDETGSQKSKMAAEKNVITRLSAYDSNKILTVRIPHFRGQEARKNECECYPMYVCVVNQRWWPLTGSRYDTTYISASIYDSNKIPTAIPMFPESGNTKGQAGILSDV